MPSASLSYLRPEVAALKQVLDKFVEEECIPAEKEFEEHIQKRTGAARWTLDAIPPCMERLKSRAKQLGLWNLFIPPHLISKLPDRSLGPSIALNYREYGVLCESMGRSPTIASEACNCGAPDTGNMEVFLEFGTPAQKRDYLIPLLRGKIRSCFLMTEPAVASSDPTNLETKLVPTGPSSFRLDGRKWWSTGAMHPKCRVALVVTKLVGSTSKHQAHTIVAVPMPQASVRCVRPLTVMGYDDAPHGHAEVLLDGVTVTRDDLVGGEGSGFLVSQARLGPGRIHHCMRAIGMASRAYEMMIKRSMERRTFGKLLCEHGGCQETIANCVMDLEAARLMTLSCAASMDDVGVKHSRDKIAAIKVAVPNLTYQVIDRAIQLHGGGGLCSDYVMADFLAKLRTLRIADGPDSVHQRTVARLEIKKAQAKLQATARL